ncbi:MAG: hypothetical protein M0Z91_10525 [Actinomycetota bacterium]|nr:hypothetical protein [Actinomycetota bacterium]
MPDRPAYRRRLAGAFLALALGLAACGRGGSTATSTTAAATTSSTAPETTSIPVESIATGFQPLAMSFVSASLGFALGHYQCAQGECYQLARTSDDGIDWFLVAPAGSVVSTLNPQGMYFADAAHGWVWGKGAAFTTNGGKSWSALVLPAGSIVDSLAVVGSQAYFLLSTPTSSPPGSYVASLFDQNWETSGGTSPVGGFSPVATADPGGFLAPGASLLGINIGRSGTADPLWIYDPAGGTSTSIPDACPTMTGPTSIPLLSGGRYLASGTGVPASKATFYVLCTANPGAGSSQKLIFGHSYSVSAQSSWSWTAVSSSAPPGGLGTAFATSPGGNFAIGAASGASFVYTQRSGSPGWASLTDSALGGAPVTQLEWIDDSHVFAVIGGPEGATLGPSTTSAAYYSSNAGASFAKLSF